jgi:hypothetical protein
MTESTIKSALPEDTDCTIGTGFAAASAGTAFVIFENIWGYLPGDVHIIL